MVAGLEDVRELRVRDERAHRHAVGDRLGAGEEVRLHAEVLPAPPHARTAHAALDFVADHQEILLVAERAHAGHELRRRGRHAALALHRLEHDRHRLVGESGLDGLEIVEVGIGETNRQRLETGLAPVLARRRDRRERTAVEAVAHRDHLVAAAVRGTPLAGELDRRLVRLGARVAEEHLAAETGDLDQLLRELHLRLVHEEVRAVREHRGLVLNRLDDALRAVADVVAADAAREIIVLLAVGVVDARPLGLGDDDARRIRRHQILLVLFNDLSALAHR